MTAAFAEGAPSYSKVRAITRVATEATLVDLAGAITASHLERTVRCYKRVEDEAGEDQNPPVDPQEQYQERYLRSWWNDDGTLSIKAKLPPAEGEMVLAALRRAADALYRQSRAGAADTNVPVEPAPRTPRRSRGNAPGRRRRHQRSRGNDGPRGRLHHDRHHTRPVPVPPT